MPHIHGWGHRVRCDEIATQVLAMTEGARVILLARSNHLERCAAKVIVVPPVLSVESEVRDPPDDRIVLYVMVSRPPPGFSEAIAAVREGFEHRTEGILEIVGSPGTMQARDRHL